MLNDGAANALGAGALKVSGGTLNANNAESSAAVTLTSGAINANVANSLGGGPLVQSGGALAIGGSQTVTVRSCATSNGVLAANATKALGAGAVTVSGGTLNAAAANAISTGTFSQSNGLVNLNFAQSPASVGLSGGLLNLGNSAAAGTGHSYLQRRHARQHQRLGDDDQRQQSANAQRRLHFPRQQSADHGQQGRHAD